MNAVATALAGGARYEERIDENGNRIRTPVKMSGREIGMAIALEAIHGSLSGLAAGRGRGQLAQPEPLHSSRAPR